VPRELFKGTADYHQLKPQALPGAAGPTDMTVSQSRELLKWRENGKGKRHSLEAMWRRYLRWRAEQRAGVGCETRGHHHRSAAFLLAFSSRVCIQSWRRPQGRG
jgi:hypothetical protein